jgi:endonuclease G
MHGAKTRATFSLADGVLTVDENSATQIPLIISSNGTNQKQISMLMLPTTASDNIEILFRAGSNSYTWTLPHALQSGNTHTYTIELEAGEEQGGGEDPDPPITLYQYMEIPAYSRGILPPGTIETRHKVGDRRWLNQSLPLPAGKIRNFTVLFDTENRLPVWIAYPLHPIYLASGNRTDEWIFDPQIPGRHQPFLANRSWQSQIPGQSFDRGHVLPSADRNATRELNRTTFYFTNVVAQNPEMNQGVWLGLEDRVRAWSRENPRDTLYVVTGNILHSPPVFAATDNNGVPSAKPQYMYKALLRRNMTDGTFTSIGFKMSNSADSEPYTQSVVSVARLEEITGFTFFPTLPEDIAVEVKGNVDIGLF